MWGASCDREDALENGRQLKKEFHFVYTKFSFGQWVILEVKVMKLPRFWRCQYVDSSYHPLVSRMQSRRSRTSTKRSNVPQENGDIPM